MKVQNHIAKKWYPIEEDMKIKTRGRCYPAKSEAGRLYWRYWGGLSKFTDQTAKPGKESSSSQNAVVNDVCCQKIPDTELGKGDSQTFTELKLRVQADGGGHDDVQFIFEFLVK